MRGCVARLPARREDRGTTTLEFVVIVPGLLLLIGLLAVAGRLAIAGTAVEAAAAAGARQASIERSAGAARSSADAAASLNLTGQGVQCATVSVATDTSGFATPVGTPAQVTVTVSCAVRLGDISVPGVPGSTTLTSTAVSPLDTYRVRS